MDYSKNIIREYKYWDVYLHENQGYLGRCYVWCKRKDAQDLTDANLEEREELFIVLLEIKKAIEKAFNADWFNYSFLGNETPHLHCHLVPRYKNLREFEGVRFEDKLWGHNYKTDNGFTTTELLLRAIQQRLKENI